MSQDRQSACFPPPSDYSQQARPPGGGNFRERCDKGGHRNRAHFGNHRGYNHHHQRHQPITFHRDKPQHYDSPLEQSERVKEQPKDRFHRNDDDDYFARIQDDEDEVPDEANDNEDAAANDDDDPLEAYMKSLEDNGDKKGDGESDTSGQFKAPRAQLQSASATGGPIRLDIDETDDIEESYYQFVERRKNQQHSSDNDEQLGDDQQDLVEYDKDGNVISVRKIKREVDPLPPIDHSLIEYNQFEKSFYKEHEEIQKLTSEQSDELRKKLEIKVTGQAPPRPVCSFAHFNFEEKLMRVIRRSEYVQPTPIQAQAIPAALSGRNLIGIAMTGSGKTAAYLWPLIVHISKQPAIRSGDGPIGLILVPTRELALQVYSETRKFSSSYKLSVVCAYGGGSKFEQSRDLESGAEIIVATPGRLIDLIKSDATNLKRVTYLVLDEADRFFEMGFEAQVRSICDHIRPDRQTLLFSATFKYKVEQLARTVTENPVKIVQKTLGEANEDVKQHFVVFKESAKKWEWLSSRLVEFTSAGSVLIFVTRIINSEELQRKLVETGKESLLLHGDMEQSERNRVIMCFKRKENDILVATDVAARGLDISHIRTVINYDVARDIDTHTHRIGRTGRAGSKGDAYTLVSTEKDKDFAGQLVRNLQSSNQEVDDELMKLAMQSHAFRKFRQQRQQHSGGGRPRNYNRDSYQEQSHHNSDHRSNHHRNYDSRPTSGGGRISHSDDHRYNQSSSSMAHSTNYRYDDRHHKRAKWDQASRKE